VHREPGTVVAVAAGHPAFNPSWAVNAVETKNDNLSWSVTAYVICG
jgi:hypothetical protein